MVLRLKTRKSRSPPGQPSPANNHLLPPHPHKPHYPSAGWSSPVARQAHNLKVIGSNPIPATNDTCKPDTTDPVPERGPGLVLVATVNARRGCRDRPPARRDDDRSEE